MPYPQRKNSVILLTRSLWET